MNFDQATTTDSSLTIQTVLDAARQIYRQQYTARSVSVATLARLMTAWQLRDRAGFEDHLYQHAYPAWPAQPSFIYGFTPTLRWEGRSMVMYF